MAKASLADLPGKDVDAKILALVPNAQEKIYPVLLETIGQRRIQAQELLLKAVNHSDQAIRSAALTALGETIALEDLPVLVAQAVNPKFAQDASIAKKALKAASIRMPDREACAAKLATAIDESSSLETKVVLLQILGDVGGNKSLQTMRAAAQSDEPKLQDTSTQLLGKWMTADAAPVLLDLAKTISEEKYQVRALRGYIRIARQFRLPPQQRAEMCRQAFAAAQRPAEQKMVLEILERYPNAKNLKLASEALQIPALKEDASRVMLAVAQKLGDKNGNVKKILAQAGLSKVDLKIIKAEYGAGETQKDVTTALQQQASDLPLIILTSTSYNNSFGGDPLPGTAKILTIQYQIDGKAGEATFPENAPILLPMPK